MEDARARHKAEQHHTFTTATIEPTAASDAELEETVRRRRKNDAILQFIQDKSQKLDLVWYCFSHQNWTDSNTRKEAKYVCQLACVPPRAPSYLRVECGGECTHHRD
jgi:hypothetical protein